MNERDSNLEVPATALCVTLQEPCLSEPFDSRANAPNILSYALYAQELRWQISRSESRRGQGQVVACKVEAGSGVPIPARSLHAGAHQRAKLDAGLAT